MKYHYYAFSFTFIKNGNSGSAWVAARMDNKEVSVKDIFRAKELAEVPNDAVLVAFSYMGHMTREEAVGEQNES